MITIDRVSYAYPGAQQAVLDEFSASFPPAALTAITGANGCGKTTLTKLMTGIVRPLAGRVTIDGTDIAPLSLAEIGSLVGCVFQNPTHQLFSTSVREEVSFGLRNLGLSDAQIAERVRHALTCFDLEEREDDFPLSLSHGEKQRLMLAAVLALRPAYIVLDEPTTGLDVVRRRALGVSLRQIAESNGCGVIVVSHERAFVSRYANAEIPMVLAGVAGATRRERQPEPPPQRRGGKAGAPRLARIDPRVKLLLMLCISTLAVVWRDPLWLASLLAFTCTVLAVGGVDLGTALRQIRGVLGVVALLFIVQCLFVRSGRPLLSVGAVTLITVDGAATALGIALRLVIVVFSALLLLTSEARDYLLAFVQCKLPYEIAFMVMTAAHFMPILRDEALDVYHAVQMRGTEIAKTTLRGKLRVYTSMTLPILTGALRRAEQTSIAMEARAFRACPRRTFLRRLKLSSADIVCLVAIPLLTAASLVTSIII